MSTTNSAPAPRPDDDPAATASAGPVAETQSHPTTRSNTQPADAPRRRPSVPAVIRRIIKERREIERTLQVINKAARFLFQSHLPRMAAALSYRTIFGLIPTLVIAIAVLGAFATEASMQATLRQLLIFTGISEIEIDEEATALAEEQAQYTPSFPFFSRKPTTDTQSLISTMPRPDVTPNASGVVASAPPASLAGGTPSLASSPNPAARPAGAPGEQPAPLGSHAPDGPDAREPVTPKLEDWITEIVSRVRGIAFEAIGAIGVLTLIYAAISMLIEVERAFNDIYHAPAGRAWGRRIPLYWTMLTLGVILILATFFVGARATAWLAQLSPALAPGTGLGTLVTFIATVLTSMVLLLGVYLWVPNTRVALRPALAGAFVAALLWETGKLGLQRYIEFSASYAKLYGSLGLLPLLLLWIYVTWLIVLFGLQVAYALQHFQSWRAEDSARDAAPSVIEPAAILGVASQIARAFDSGKPRTLPEIAAGAAIDERVAGLMLDRLVAAGLALRTEHPRDGVTLARPADSIPMADLLRLGFEMVGAVTGPAAELREQAITSLGQRTLAGARRLDQAAPSPTAPTPVGHANAGTAAHPHRPQDIERHEPDHAARNGSPASTPATPTAPSRGS